MCVTTERVMIRCGSHPDCFVGQWIKWINKYDPLSTLMEKYSTLNSGTLLHEHNRVVSLPFILQQPSSLHNGKYNISY